jgi:hypothetical protein
MTIAGPSGALHGGCHCGRVAIAVPGRPEYLNVCNCTLCTKLAGMWGYFPRSQVTIGGRTRGYIRTDLDETYLETHFCEGCGATTHWVPLRADMPDRMGVNMRLFDPDALTGIELRYGNNRDETPGAPRFHRAPTVFSAAGVTA